MHTQLIICALVELCSMLFSDVEFRICTNNVRCMKTLVDVVYCWPTSFANKCRPRSKTPIWCAHAMADVCKPWIMLYAIGRCFLVEAWRPQMISVSQCADIVNYVCRTWLILQSLWQCGFPEKHIPCSCVKAFADVICHWMTSTYWYIPATHDAGKQHSMSVE